MNGRLFLIPLFFSVICFSGCFSVRSNEQFAYRKLSPAEYASVLKDSSGYYLIDVRTTGEYRKSHMPGAVNFSYLKFHFGRDVDSLDRNRLVLLYCQTCHRSPLAARKMKHKGFRSVVDLRGGYQHWKRT